MSDILPHFKATDKVGGSLLKALLQVYEERFERQYGFFRSYIQKVIYRDLDCGDLYNGFDRVKCKYCGHD